MDPTTLVTFLFQAPPEVRVLELIGSWDNFSQPYQMHHDRRRGRGLWSGCFKFTDIIFDGDTPCWTKPRSGGLKQGGLYWYYYRLDHGAEAYDDSREWTANCPLMPGQVVNVMDVPHEIVEPPSRCRSAGHLELEGTLSSWPGPMPHRQTLEPSDKFAALEPPPVSKVHGRCVSDVALNERFDHEATSLAPSIVSPLGTPCGDGDQSRTLEDPAPTLVRTADRTASCRYSSDVDAYAATSTQRKEQPVEPSHSFPLPPSGPSCQDPESYAVMNFEFNETEYRDAEDALSDVEEGDESSVFGPRSVRDVQIYGSRPTTSDSGQQWRPRVYSHHSGDLYAHAIGKDQPEPAPRLEPLSLLLSGGSLAEEERSPVTDQGTFAGAPSGVWSPAFSAATVSSNGGGLNTPFRLSGGYSRGAHHEYSNDQHALADIAERLESLHIGGADNSRPPPKEHQQCRDDARPRVFTGYALPQSTIGDQQSLGKLSSHNTGFAAPDLPLPATFGDSMAEDDIFSELGYLGGSIS
ncbi:hypothetical protein LTR85_003906 [Meristemomyces frigidus]|nr:hypothetical protein LTR85_003906 [Meristemomyces frigidus]